MKRLSALLALLLILAGCAPAKPVDAPPPSAPGVPETSSSEAALPEKSDTPAASLPDMPAPDALPVTEIGAIELPQTFYTSTAGYSAELLTPAQYDMSLDPQRGGPRGFVDAEVFYLGQGGKYAIANANGKIMSEFKYDHSDTWQSVGGVVNVIESGRESLLDARDGTILVPDHYDSAWPVPDGDWTKDGGLYKATNGEKTDIIDRTGKTVFQIERGDDIYILEDRLILIHQDAMIKLYDAKTYSPVNNFSCQSMNLLRYGENEDVLIGVNTTDVWGVCDADGKFITDMVYDEIGHFSGDYASFTKDGKKGVLRADGKVVVKPTWEDLIVFDRSASVFNGDKWGAITDLDSGKVTIEPRYDFISSFRDGGNASFERDGSYGLIDREGNEIIPAKYDSMIYASPEFEKGYYLIDGGDGPGSAGIISGGKVILTSDHYIWGRGVNPVYAEDEPYNLVCTPRFKWGFIDRTGKFVVDAKYDNAEGYIRGRNVAFVELDGKISLIDRKGNSVLDTVFSDLIAFNPDTMVCAMEYTNDKGEVKSCLVKINVPA